MKGRRGTAALAGVTAVVMGLAGALSASDARADRPTHPGRIVASADITWNLYCGGFPITYPGHLELVGVDVDPSLPENPWDRQDDRISMTITRAGETFAQDPLWMFISDQRATIFISQGAAGWTIFDGGNPGSRLTGDSPFGYPATLDSMQFWNMGTTCRWLIYLTDGNINITGPR